MSVPATPISRIFKRKCPAYQTFGARMTKFAELGTSAPFMDETGESVLTTSASTR
jgi:hypothetical protein